MAVLLPLAGHAREAGNEIKVIPNSVVVTRYDGISNDLLTAGLGAAGLQSAVAPSVSSPPTTVELRRLAIYNNYRALLDMTTAGGYGTFYGPTGTGSGPVSNSSGTIAGHEILAFATSEDRQTNITIMVQVPDSYDRANGCIIAAPSSGSRGVYGAIATAGEWGLKHGCAVAYTDKGTGTGFDDLQNNVVDLLQGTPSGANTAGASSEFTAALSPDQRSRYNAAFPNRFAFKHAHSQVNPERNWGQDVLVAVRFARQLLREDTDRSEQERGGDRRRPIVIASSVSNGGGASLRAVEQDQDHLIDAVVVSEPNVNPVFDNRFTINQAGRPPLVNHSRPLIDYITIENVYEGCAAAGYTLAQAPFNFAPSAARCTTLKAAGLLQSTTTADQSAEAQAILNRYGFLPEQNFVQPVLWFSYVPQSIAVTYANAYGQFSVADNLCGYSFAAVDTNKKPTLLAPAAEAILFATSNGIPPTGGVSLVNNAAGLEDRASTPDQDLAGALCLRSLATGLDDTGNPLSGTDARHARLVRRGAREILATGDLHGVPALVVTGRSDDILPPNFTSRAYFGLNKSVEGRRSQLRYYEVTNANHLDNILALAGFDTTLVPLHRYYLEALDLMLAHLRSGAPLPDSQVVHTTTRGGTPGSAPALTATNVPPIAATPGASSITFGGGAVNIPN